MVRTDARRDDGRGERGLFRRRGLLPYEPHRTTYSEQAIGRGAYDSPEVPVHVSIQTGNSAMDIVVVRTQ